MTAPDDDLAPCERILDAQIQARHDERPDEVERLHKELLACLPADETRLRGWSHAEMGFVLRKTGDLDRAEHHFRKAIALRPRNELASLGLFHTLAALGRWNDGLAEIVRFVKLRDSAEYRELLNDGVRRESFGRSRELVDEARALLARWN